ncbi:MAG: SUMF1/EgtB/PvdO family nonheme iron enzyme [Spirochaetia bacterium]
MLNQNLIPLFRSPGPPSEAGAVKSYNPNSLGIYDMSGNVCEWCFTKYAAGRINWAEA